MGGEEVRKNSPTGVTDTRDSRPGPGSVNYCHSIASSVREYITTKYPGSRMNNEPSSVSKFDEI